MSRKPQPLYADDALIAASRLTPAEMLSIEEDVLRSLRDAQARVVEAAARGGAEQRAAQPLPPLVIRGKVHGGGRGGIRSPSVHPG